jgi:hypothetical protein
LTRDAAGRKDARRLVDDRIYGQLRADDAHGSFSWMTRVGARM